MNFSKERKYFEALMFCLGGNHCRYLVTIFTWHSFYMVWTVAAPSGLLNHWVYHMMKLPRSWQVLWGWWSGNQICFFLKAHHESILINCLANGWFLLLVYRFGCLLISLWWGSNSIQGISIDHLFTSTVGDGIFLLEIGNLFEFPS
jgi:hypothetical protein